MTDILEKLTKGKISYALPSGTVYEGPTLLETECFLEIRNLRDRVKDLELALTPDANTKAAYIGEFKIKNSEHNPDYDENFDLNDYDIETFTDQSLGELIRAKTSEVYNREITIDWTTIKDIMKAIKDYADGLSAPVQD